MLTPSFPLEKNLAQFEQVLLNRDQELPLNYQAENKLVNYYLEYSTLT